MREEEDQEVAKEVMVDLGGVREEGDGCYKEANLGLSFNLQERKCELYWS